MFRHLALLGLVLMLVAGVAPALAQAPQQPGLAPPPATAARPSHVEGTVSKVNPAAGTVAISWGWFGILGKTLQVTPDTQIQMQGQPATLADVREGERVKAAYEPRDGKSVATSIELVPREMKP